MRRPWVADDLIVGMVFGDDYEDMAIGLDFGFAAFGDGDTPEK